MIKQSFQVWQKDNIYCACMFLAYLFEIFRNFQSGSLLWLQSQAKTYVKMKELYPKPMAITMP